MCTAVKHPVPDRVKLSSVIFDIRPLWRSGLSVRVPRCQRGRQKVNDYWYITSFHYVVCVWTENCELFGWVLQASRGSLRRAVSSLVIFSCSRAELELHCHTANPHPVHTCILINMPVNKSYKSCLSVRDFKFFCHYVTSWDASYTRKQRFLKVCNSIWYDLIREFAMD